MSNIAQGEVTQSQVRKGVDPSVANQLDTATPVEQQIDDMYAIIDALKTCQLVTLRDNQMVSRCMAIGQREGPDVLMLCNKDSNKVKELQKNPQANLSMIDTNSTNNWISLSGTAEVSSNKDSIKKCYNPLVSAWFGDLGDGVHNGTPDDPRMQVIKFTTDYASYWKQEKTAVGSLVDIVASAATGKVATPGPCREIKSADLQKARQVKA